MFTGIIQGQGEILAFQGNRTERRFRIRPHCAMPHMTDGESIAVNGVCLSVEEHGADFFVAYASAETLSRTTLGALCAGDFVNLERALALGERLGGHMVSGHVDCLATVRSIRPAGQSLRCRLSFPAEYAPQIIPKGSVALDGISLTVNDCGPDFLEVNIIPDTSKRTTMRRWKSGTLVNLETDLIGKYVHSLLSAWRQAPGMQQTLPKGDNAGRLSREMLLRNGFL